MEPGIGVHADGALEPRAGGHAQAQRQHRLRAEGERAQRQHRPERPHLAHQEALAPRAADRLARAVVALGEELALVAAPEQRLAGGGIRAAQRADALPDQVLAEDALHLVALDQVGVELRRVLLHRRQARELGEVVEHQVGAAGFERVDDAAVAVRVLGEGPHDVAGRVRREALGEEERDREIRHGADRLAGRRRLAHVLHHLVQHARLRRPRMDACARAAQRLGLVRAHRGQQPRGERAGDEQRRLRGAPRARPRRQQLVQPRQRRQPQRAGQHRQVHVVLRPHHVAEQQQRGGEVEQGALLQRSCAPLRIAQQAAPQPLAPAEPRQPGQRRQHAELHRQLEERRLAVEPALEQRLPIRARRDDQARHPGVDAAELAQRRVLREQRPGRRQPRVAEARHADEVVQHRLLHHASELALHQEVQRRDDADDGAGAEEVGEAARRALARAARGGDQRGGGGEQRRGAVVLLAEHADAEEQAGAAQRVAAAALEMAEEQQQRCGLEQQRGGAVAVDLPVREGPGPVQPQERDAQQRPAHRHQPPQQAEAQRGEGRELDAHQPARHQDRRLEDPEAQRQQVEGAGQRVAGGVAVELPAAEDQVRVREHVALVHHAEPAIEERQLVAERGGGDGQRRGGGVRADGGGETRGVHGSRTSRGSAKPASSGVSPAALSVEVESSRWASRPATASSGRSSSNQPRSSSRVCGRSVRS